MFQSVFIEGRFMSFWHTALLLVVASAPLVKADVTPLSGTFTTSFSAVREGTFNTTTIQIQGANFSLTGNFPCDAFVQFASTGGGQTVTFDPSVSVTELGDTSPSYCFPPAYFNGLALTYQGQTYNNVQLVLNFKGAKALVPNTDPPGFYGGAVSGVAFTVSGLISVYSSIGYPDGPAGPLLFSLPLSGVGLYSAMGGSANPGTQVVGASGQATFKFLPPVTAFSTDTTTQGTWTGTYGSEGYVIPDGPTYLPSYAAVKIQPASTYIWTPQTSDPRAVQNGPGATSNIASAFTSNSFNIAFNFTDNFPHRVAFYLLDFDTSGRSETLTVTDSNTGAVLDTETVSNFHNGTYAVFNLQESETVNVKSNGGANAVLSGIFFGPASALATNPGPATAIVQPLSLDSTTQGNWLNHYGDNGYMIADGSIGTVYPTNTSTTVTGDFTYAWALQTTDPRALNNYPVSGNFNIAAAYTQYPGSSFNINVFTPTTGYQRVALYLLDWDKSGRSETISVSDFSTGTVLNTQSVSNFQGGVYVSWLITGNVVMTVKPVGSASPVVSGVFIN